MKNFITTLPLLCVFLLLGCSIVEKDAAIDPAWAKLASDNSYFDGKSYFNDDASVLTLTSGRMIYTFKHVESTPTSATYTGRVFGLDISYSFSGGDIFGGIVTGNTISGQFEWDNNPLLGGAFIISDDDLYMFSSDGKELTNRVYNTSSKKFTDTVFTSTDFITYTSAGNTIELSSLSAKGGKIGDIDFSFLPFTLGTVDDTLKNATKSDNFYSDSMRLDYDDDSYFISDSDVEVYSQKDENNKNLELEKYIANYVTNIVNDSMENIGAGDIYLQLDDKGMIIAGESSTDYSDYISQYDSGSIFVFSSVGGSIIVNGSIEGGGYGIYVCTSAKISGSIIVNGSITGDEYGIYVDSTATISGSIIVNGSITGDEYGIYVHSTATISGSIIVNGSVTASGSYGTGIRVDSTVKISGSIIVNGSVTASGSYGTGIRVNSTISGSIIVNGSITGDDYGTGIRVDSTVEGSIIVNGSVTGGSLGIYIFPTATISGSIIVSGSVSSIHDDTGKSITYTDVTSIYRYTYLTPDMSDEVSAMVFSGTRESDKAPASVVEPIYLP